MIIKFKFNSELTLLKIFVDKLNVSNSDGSKFDASEGSNSDHDTSTSDDISHSTDPILKSPTFGPYSVPITDLSCQHQT